MKRAIALCAALCVAFAAHAEVTITVQDAPTSIACPMPEPVMEKQKDGSYIRQSMQQTYTVACMSQPSSHQERWTDYPEKGGKPIWNSVLDCMKGGCITTTPIPASK